MEHPLPTVPAPGSDRPPPTASDWSRVESPRPPGRSSSFTVGYLIGTSFRTWGRNALFFSALGGLASLPMAMVSYRMYSEMGLFPDPASASNPFASNPVVVFWRLFLAGMLVSIVVWGLANTAVIHGTAQALRGTRVSPGAALLAAVHRTPYVIAVVLLSVVAMIGTACTLVVPFFLMVVWCAALPSTVLEGTGPLRALARSWDLTRGHRWVLLAGFLVLTLSMAAVVLVLEGVALGLLTASGGTGALGPGKPLGATMAAYQVCAGMLGAVTTVGMAVSHHGLRAAKEGGDPAALERVFE